MEGDGVRGGEGEGGGGGVEVGDFVGHGRGDLLVELVGCGVLDVI